MGKLENEAQKKYQMECNIMPWPECRCHRQGWYESTSTDLSLNREHGILNQVIICCPNITWRNQDCGLYVLLWWQVKSKLKTSKHRHVHCSMPINATTRTDNLITGNKLEWLVISIKQRQLPIKAIEMSNLTQKP